MHLSDYRVLAMPRPLFAALTVLLAVATLAVGACGDGDGSVDPTATAGNMAATETPVTGAMSLTSTAFADNGSMPVPYTCDGASISPPLTIGGVPEGAVSLSLTVIDIDGPGGAFVHWTVWNIAPAAGDVAEGTVPLGGIEGLTGRGEPGYTGPCPPSGTHRYVFTLSALDTALDLDPSATDADALASAIEGHVLATARLTGTYAR